MPALLSVRDLRTSFQTRKGQVQAVDGLSFDVAAGEVLGIAGESGSGKSVTALSILGLLPGPPACVTSGQVLWEGRDLVGRSQAEMRRIRGAEIAMIFQDSATALNPLLTIGRQIADVLRAHTSCSRHAAMGRAGELLALVGMPGAATAVEAFPHQLSGGMRQRATIAMAIACSPSLILADEPTTGLDVTIQAQVMEVLRRTTQDAGSSVILITHDLAVLAGAADRVMVMYAGQIVEEGSVEQVYKRARMPYTWGLLESASRPDRPPAPGQRGIAGQPPSMLEPPSGCRFHPRCSQRDEQRCPTDRPDLRQTEPGQRTRCHFALEPGWLSPRERTDEPGRASPHQSGTRESEKAPIEADTIDSTSANDSVGRRDDKSVPLLEVVGLEKHFAVRRGSLTNRKQGEVRALDGVSFTLERGETFGLVGESGCGKSTLARLILGLLRPTAGRVRFDGHDLVAAKGRELRGLRSSVQIVFQDAYASLNPRHKVFEILTEPLVVHGLRKTEARARAGDMMELVGLAREHASRYPHELSAGQRQRVAVARALSLEPKLVVLDEPVSALDASMGAQIIGLLDDLQARLGLTYLLIAHDLSVVRRMSRRAAAMYLGQIVELSDRGLLFDNPRHPYTVALLSAVPVPDPAIERTRDRVVLAGEVPSSADPPSGCRFNPRCWKAQDICRTTAPPLEPKAPGQWVACHFPEQGAG